MKTENNRNLFYVATGLISSGLNSYDHSDAEISALAKRICKSDISENIRFWFARAKTGQVEVNPYWPRGSAIIIACFFVKDGKFDIDACLSFFDSTGAMVDPIGADDFRAWIAELPKVLSYFEDPAFQPLWSEYCRIVDSRIPKWNLMIDEAINTAHGFFGENAPIMTFAPNLFAAYNTDFVHIQNKIITIASEPDIEGMLHETLHPVVALQRDKITAFSAENGLSGFANREKMMKYGYMVDDSVASIAHVIEECFVRAISVVLSNKNDKRLQSHVEFGCDGVPFIAEQFINISPTIENFGTFIDIVLYGSNQR